MLADDNTLTVNINRLRKKLDEAGIHDFILTKKVSVTSLQTLNETKGKQRDESKKFRQTDQTISFQRQKKLLFYIFLSLQYFL